MSSAPEIMSELFVEKSLLHVYRNSSSYSESRFDLCIRGATLISLCAISLVLVISKQDLFPVAVRSITSWLSLGFTYATTILGFLVAGFTIFSTMTRTEVFIALAREKHATLGVSQLKFIFFSFLRVFILHITLIFACVAVTMLKDSSAIYLSIICNEQQSILIKKVVVLITLPVIGCLIVSTLLHLKTFVWNLYQSIIIAVAGAAMLYELDGAAAKAQGAP